MPLFKHEIPALHNGVSQQPATVRSDDQCSEEINAWPSVVNGSGKRQPLEHIARLYATKQTGAKIHTINRDITERYVVVITNGDLKVFGIDGTEKTVTFPDGKGYLTSADPESDFHLVSVADYTFVVNRATKTQLAAAGADTTAQPSYYYWLSNKTGSGDAQQLQYDPNPSIALADLKGDVQTQQDLPQTPSNGDVYRITGYGSLQSEYVRRNGSVWEECYKPGIQNAIDATTMPHALVRGPNGDFVFAPFSWAPRRVGDDVMNPAPSFIGRTIRDVYFWRNRLCFVSDENTIMSRASDFGNFFRMTQVELLSDDVVDVATSSTSVSVLNYAVPFRSKLLLFSDQTQFVLSVKDVLTPSTVSIDELTHYKTVPNVKPVSAGEEAYFAHEPGAGQTSSGYVVLHDYEVLPGSQDLTTADDITAHVPKFIPAGIRCLAASTEYDVLFALTKGAKNNIYVYKSFWRADRKIQQAWNYWALDAGDEVVSVAVLDDYAYFIINRDTGMYLEKVALIPDIAPGTMPFNILLDRRSTVTGVYLSTSDETEFTLPYAPNQATFQIVLGSAFADPATLLDPSQYTWVAADTVRVPGQWDAGSVYVGTTYKYRHAFNRAYYRDRNGTAVTTGRFQLAAWTVNFVNTGYFKTVVNSYGQDDYIETIVPALLSEFTGRTVGDSALRLSTPILTDGTFTFSVYGDSALAVVAVENESHVPCCFQSAEYEGTYTSRSAVL